MSCMQELSYINSALALRGIRAICGLCIEMEGVVVERWGLGTVVDVASWQGYGDEVGLSRAMGVGRRWERWGDGLDV